MVTGSQDSRGRRPYETLTYMPQLDALRTFAVMGVFLTHYVRFDTELLDAGDWGGWGVQLFFVLSGYLITGILLACRQNIDEGHLTFGKGLGHFYGRRFLRLMPIYYLTLAIMLVINPPLWDRLLWFATYTQNFLFAQAHTYADPNLDPGLALGHFWTLAVEEQFYLMWPLLTFLLPRRWLVPTLVCVIFSSIPFRFVLLAVGVEWLEVRVLTPSQFDTLGIGALLAVLHHTARDGYAKAERLTNILIWPGLALMVVYIVCRLINNRYGEHPPIPNGLLLLLVNGPSSAMVFVWVIHRASRGFTGVTGAVLTFSPLIYLGRISYGLYVYHNLVPLVFKRYIFPYFDIAPPQYDVVRFAVYGGGTILVSMVSWHLIERPLQRLKKYLRYRE